MFKTSLQKEKIKKREGKILEKSNQHDFLIFNLPKKGGVSCDVRNLLYLKRSNIEQGEMIESSIEAKNK